MADILLWRVFCETDNNYEYIWDTVAPTLCPIDELHNIKSDSINNLSTINIYRTLDNTESPFDLTQYNFYRCDTTNGEIMFNLISNESFNKDRVIIIQKISGDNTLTINAEASKTINGTTSVTLTTDKSFINLIADGDGNWNNINSDEINIEELMTFNDKSVSLIPGGAKGSLLVNNSQDLSYLNVGINNDVLTVDNTQPLGLKWANSGLFTGSKIIFVGDSTMVSNNNSNYKVFYRIIFPGTQKFNLSSCHVLCYGDDNQTDSSRYDDNSDSDSDSGLTYGKLRLFNYTTGLVIAEKLHVSQSYHIETFTTFNNIPTGLSIIELHGAKMNCFGCLLN